MGCSGLAIFQSVTQPNPLFWGSNPLLFTLVSGCGLCTHRLQAPNPFKDYKHQTDIPTDRHQTELWVIKNLLFFFSISTVNAVWETAPPARFMMLGQTHVNGWSRVIASQNGGSTSYIFPFRLGVLQWSRHLFNYWKNKKTIIVKEFLILLIWNWIYIWS